MQIKDLKHNKKNPRKISDSKLQALKDSVAKFGDLSGFVYNRQTKQLVSGHQRSKTLPPDSTIKIERKFDEPTKSMTVAEGYVEFEGERFKYREVDASPEWEIEALLAANKHGGEWDRDVLKLALADFPQLDLRLSGFELGELRSMNIEFNPVKIAPLTPIRNEESTDEEQAGFDSEDGEEQSDEEYLRENPGPDYLTEKERLPDLINRTGSIPDAREPAPLVNVDVVEDADPFDTVVEKNETKNEKQIVIIDCQGSVEQKLLLKEFLRTSKIEEQFKVKIY